MNHVLMGIIMNDRQGNTGQMTEGRDRVWMRKQRTFAEGGGFPADVNDYDVSNIIEEQDGESIAPCQVECGEEIPCTDDIHKARRVCSAVLRNPHGRRSVSHRMPSNDDVP